MLGYQRDVKGHRLWCTEPGNNKVIINRDVVFKENEMPYLAGKASGTRVEVEPLVNDHIPDEGIQKESDMNEADVRQEP